MSDLDGQQPVNPYDALVVKAAMERATKKRGALIVGAIVALIVIASGVYWKATEHDRILHDRAKRNLCDLYVFDHMDDYAKCIDLEKAYNDQS